MTLPRQAICRVLAESEDTFLSASSIHESVSATVGQIDASTVYRTLDELSHIGLVHHVHFGSGQPRLWHLTVTDDHEHLVCESCGKTIEVPRAEFAPLYEVLHSKYGFRPNGHHFAFLGFCDECGPAEADHHHSGEAGQE